MPIVTKGGDVCPEPSVSMRCSGELAPAAAPCRWAGLEKASLYRRKFGRKDGPGIGERISGLHPKTAEIICHDKRRAIFHGSWWY